MDVLMVTADLFTSGLTTHVLSLARALRRRGHRVHLALTHPPTVGHHRKAYLRELEQAEVRTLVLPPPAAVVDWCQRPGTHYDLVHVHSARSLEHGQRLAAAMGIPLVVTCHGLGLQQPHFRPALEAAARLICVGPRIAATLDHFRDKLAIIGNGVDLQRFRPGVREAAFTILYAGRVDRRKRPGVIALCHAVDRLPADVRFWVASNRPLPSRRAEHLGWRPDVHRYMARAHVVVGTGLAVREGMASGTACLVLGHRYHGLVDPESLSEERFPDFSGLDPMDAEPAADAIHRDLALLYGNRPLLNRFMESGRRCAEARFSLEAMVDATLRVYQEALAAHRPGAARHGDPARGKAPRPRGLAWRARVEAEGRSAAPSGLDALPGVFRSPRGWMHTPVGTGLQAGKPTTDWG